MTTEQKWKIRAPRYQRELEQGGRGGKGGSGGKGRWYIWRVPPEYASRTRPDHLRLNGRLFNWDDPPVHDSRTGERAHPGMDGRCRCYAEFVERPSDALDRQAPAPDPAPVPLAGEAAGEDAGREDVPAQAGQGEFDPP